MKKVLFLMMAMVAICSCSNKEKYTIEGSLQDPNYEDMKLVIQQVANNQIVAVDTMTIKSGKFSFKGTIDSVAIKNVFAPDTTGIVPFVFIVEKGIITVDITDNEAKIGGTPLNDKLQAFNDKFMSNTRKGRDLIAEYTKKQETGSATEQDETSLKETLTGLAKENTRMMVAFAKENIDNILGEYCFMSYYFRVDSQTREEMNSFVTPKIKSLLNI